ncbi:MAG: hypothetical protein LBQ22_02505 [Bacteroidales bacterium]|jgi:hypothetical protein|nr:hypothetical protein [Bacteroidales bacterium]
MEYEDYIKRQFDQLGRVLGKIIAGLIGQKNQGKVGMMIESANHVLENELDFNIDELLSIEPANFIHFLKVEKGLSNSNMEKIADILFLVADDDADITYKEKLYEKCLIIYEYLDNNEKLYSLSRHEKLENIKKFLNK